MPTQILTAPAAATKPRWTTNDEIGQAWSALARHRGGLDGLCDACGVQSPCAGKVWARNVLQTVGLLP